LKRYHLAAAGDVNAFFGLTLDNVANLVLTVGLLSTAFGFPAKFALQFMIPGTALGVLVGDLWFTWLAVGLARKTGAPVTAMPLGLDTPSTIGMVLFVLGPAFLEGQRRGMDLDGAARYAWQIGMAALVISGIFKLGCAAVADWVRRCVPRAGLLGSLTAIALVLISFLPLLEIFELPLIGLVSLVIVFGTLTARIRLPLGIPGALVAVLVAGAGYYALKSWGWIDGGHDNPPVASSLGVNVPWPTLGWLNGLQDCLGYLPVVLPFALATVVGGIDCTESAAAAGDHYDTRRIVAVEAVATLVAGVCGGVIQTTPYIGHPAYKAMGGRAAYTLATGIFIGGAGIFGYFAPIYTWVPQAAIFPILVFVGLEITAQSFHATPARHYPAVALACLPALAYLALLFVEPLLGPEGVTRLTNPLKEQIQTLRVLGGGFILTSLIWASMLAAIVDRRLRTAALFCAIAGAFSLFGVIHSPFPGNPLFLPWSLPDGSQLAPALTPLQVGASYAGAALLLVAWSALVGDGGITDPDGI
jgi:AGZA family xanthine/uracil permease-like MFS transporter